MEMILHSREFRYARLLVSILIVGILTADTIWAWTNRDPDFLSRINPWVTFAISIEIFIWGLLPSKILNKLKFYVQGLEVGLDEGLWIAFGWWVVLTLRLAFFPQPAQVVGFDRASWLCVYISMIIFALGNWLLRHRFQ